jgi:hypothetical protein
LGFCNEKRIEILSRDVTDDLRGAIDHYGTSCFTIDQFALSFGRKCAKKLVGIETRRRLSPAPAWDFVAPHLHRPDEIPNPRRRFQSRTLTIPTPSRKRTRDDSWIDDQSVNDMDVVAIEGEDVDAGNKIEPLKIDSVSSLRKEETTKLDDRRSNDV